MSSFKGLNLFGSGPHTFRCGPRGQLVTLDYLSGGGSGSTAQGLTDWTIEVAGRLVANSTGALGTLRDAIIAQVEAAATPVPGTLIDNAGRSFSGLSLVRYEELGPTDHGRSVSVAYRAVFQKL